MIADSIISDDMWAQAPDEPRRAFLFFAEAAYERLKFLEANEEAQAPHTFPEWRKQYVYEVATIAAELGISGLFDPDTAVASGGHMNQFDVHLARVLTRIKIAMRSELRAESVALTFQTKADIRNHLEELRDKINKANISDALRAALHKRVDAVEGELDKARSSMTVFWALAGAMTMASTIVGTMADFPSALETTSDLVQLVHNDKAREEANENKLHQPLIQGGATPRLTDQGRKSGKGKDAEGGTN